jgi:hemoglobin-like flavoprotein
MDQVDTASPETRQGNSCGPISVAEEGALNELTERRKHIIRTSWRAVKFGLDVKATEIFYDKLFEEYPMVRPMFQDDMESQYNKLYQAVSLAVDCLDDMDNLVPVLQKLGVAHGGFGVVRAHYEAVTECFLWTLTTYILSQMPNNNAINWIFEVSDAWAWALSLIGTVMADAADEVSEERRKKMIASREAITQAGVEVREERRKRLAASLDGP